MAKFKPYVLRSISQPVNEDVLVVHETFGGVRVLARPLVMPGIGYGVVDKVLLDDWLPGAVWPRYQPSKTPLHVIVDTIKNSMLTHGGSPEAVRLFNDLAPLTRKELQVAKEKLAPKAAKTEKAPKTEAAAKPARKGNPEALAKARAAKAEKGPDKRKLTLVEKTNPKREGTRAHGVYELYKKAKTVQDFLDAGGTMADIRYDSDKEYISIA